MAEKRTCPFVGIIEGGNVGVGPPIQVQGGSSGVFRHAYCREEKCALWVDTFKDKGRSGALGPYRGCAFSVIALRLIRGEG